MLEISESQYEYSIIFREGSTFVQNALSNLCTTSQNQYFTKIRSQRPEIRSQRSEIRSQRSEIRDQRSGLWI